ncbi:arylamine N-acetyltransferase family protein [Umezawaea beigongshangensis]|uniref:arylamine N-acetyltransferase family protein n=1 Tax=Umezawaea beigongshangensis TaxID=2780383 RepID=UPI0018F16D2B|nr:arylamine N-acetyltransferase [Umezawaea beigongshangensis]
MTGALDVPAFLARLHLRDAEAPGVEALRRLHTAFVETVPYENLDVLLERPTSIGPAAAVERIVRRRRGGYCFHLNSAFAALLRALGYRVHLHRAGVHADGDEPGINRNHAALTVTGVPGDDGEGWYADVGLGDGPRVPLPLRTGEHREGPFTYRMERSPVARGGWRFVHDVRGSFPALDFAPEPVTTDDFLAKHRELSTSPDSVFTGVCVVHRLRAGDVDQMRGLVLSRLRSSSRTVLETPGDWYTALADVFGLPLRDVSPVNRDRLWRRVVAQHDAHLLVS